MKLTAKPLILLLLSGCATQAPDKFYYVDVAAAQKQFDSALERQPLEAVPQKSLQQVINACRKPQESDIKQFGADYWQTPSEYEKGDCDDFVMCAYYQLQAHYQTNIVVGVVGRTGHALIEVNDEFVLDNNTAAPMPKEKYYKLIKFNFKQSIES